MTPCGRCQANAATPPCTACPLYGAWLERCGLAPSDERWADYQAWVSHGFWDLYWRMHRINRRLEHRAQILTLVRRYPRAADRLSELTRRTSP